MALARRMGERGARALVACGLLVVPGLAGCGGATPLLHPAHVLHEGDVTAGAGLSGQIAAGNASSAITSARQTTVTGLAPVNGGDDTYRKGALAIAAVSPGVAPFVGARVGIGYDSEGGLAYTGRNLRVDARHAFETRSFALSIGAGAHGVLGHRNSASSADLVGLDTNGVHGYGFDIPVLVGWRSDAELFSVWGGGRFGYEHLAGDIGLGLQVPGGAGPDCTAHPDLGPQSCGASIAGTRFWGGGVVGFTIGFRHLFVSMELDVDYQHASGTFTSNVDRNDGKPRPSASASLDGVSIAPAGALVGRF